MQLYACKLENAYNPQEKIAPRDIFVADIWLK